MCSAKTRQVLMVKAPVLEPIGLGSILSRGFIEGHDFTTRHGRFRGRPPQGAESMDLAYKGLEDINSPHSRAVSTSSSTCFALCALNGCCNQFYCISFHLCPASERCPMSGLALEQLLNPVRVSDVQGTCVRSGQWTQGVPLCGVRGWGPV